MTVPTGARQPRSAREPAIDFLVIGAQKCGTTWISHLLSQHPEIHVPKRKELHYFNESSQLDKGLDWYREQFAPQRGERFLAEATPNYFWNHALPDDRYASINIFDIAPLVRRINPDARLIVSLRDPADRAVSAYYHYIATGLIDPRMPFAEAQKWYGTRSMGLYAAHYRHWLQSFPREQILTLIFERDIREAVNRPRTVERIFEHLGVSVPEALEYEEARNSRASYLAMQTARYVPPRSIAGWVIRRVAGALVPSALDRRFKPSVTDVDRARLREFYRPHNAELADLIGIDLGGLWS